jgi:hypothetical protein
MQSSISLLEKCMYGNITRYMNSVNFHQWQQLQCTCTHYVLTYQYSACAPVDGQLNLTAFTTFCFCSTQAFIKFLWCLLPIFTYSLCVFYVTNILVCTAVLMQMIPHYILHIMLSTTVPHLRWSFNIGKAQFLFPQWATKIIVVTWQGS